GAEGFGAVRVDARRDGLSLPDLRRRRGGRDMKFLIPDGPSAVGSVVARLVDGTRPAYAGGEPMGRALFVKVWYPAACAGTQPERLWDELRHDPRTPRPLRLVLA